MRHSRVTVRPLRILTLLIGAAVLFPGCVPDRLLFSNPQSPHFAPLPPDLDFRDVLFPSDTLRLHGWYLPGRTDGPLVLYFHGTGTSLAREIDTLRQLRENLGVAVFAFDYRGFGYSEGNPSVAGIFADARAALRFLENRGTPQTLVYYGHSLGAAVALELALEKPPAALVLESPFTSLLDLIGWHNPTAGAWLAWLFPDYYNNLRKIDDLTSPLLLIHGTADRKVPAAMAGRLFDRATGPKSLLLIAGGNHEAPRLADDGSYWEGWRRFLDRCLPENRRMAVTPAIEQPTAAPLQGQTSETP